MTLTLDPTAIDLATLRQLWQGAAAGLNDAAMARVSGAADSVGRIVAGGETVYGINTGFGLLANTAIPADRLADLQTNLILSHSAGLGDPLPRHVTRLMIVLKLLGLGRGGHPPGRQAARQQRHAIRHVHAPRFPGQLAPAQRPQSLLLLQHGYG